MRKLYFIFLLISATAFAQFDDVGEVAEDLLLLTDRYITPAAEGAVYQVGGGWYTSARPKAMWDLELSAQANLLFIPSKFTSFTFSESELQNLSIQGGQTQTEIPTALGNDNAVVLEGTILNNPFEFETPEGLNRSSMPHANLQASLGVWGGTTLIARYSPKIKIDKTKLQHLGVGLQHNISQWFTPEDYQGIQLSALGSYTYFTIDTQFSPVDLTLGSLEEMEVDSNSYFFSLIASKQFSDIDITAALGLTSTKYNYALDGDGEALIDLLNQLAGSLSKSETDVRAELGAVYHLDDFSINTMLLVGKFTHLTLGFNYTFHLKGE